LLDAVRNAAAGMEAVTELEREAFREAHRAALTAARQRTADARNEARQRRAEAIRAADDAGVPRELIAAAAGLQWPMSRQRWSKLRTG
jgi:uncharacterized membrane protein